MRFFLPVLAMPRLYKLSKKYTISLMKRVLASLVIILMAAAAVFMIGWVQFGIKPGECGVMVSKTSGVLERPLLPGSFVWRWERLLPTNVTIHKFRMEPYRSVQSYSGSLPGADLYSKMLDSVPDFSYELDVAVQLSPKAESLVSLVEKNEISAQEDLDAYMENKAKVVSAIVADRILPSAIPTADSSSRWTGYMIAKALDKSALDSISAAGSGDLEAVTLNSVEISKALIPDMESYTEIQGLYGNYKDELEKSIREKASVYADQMNEEERSVRLLEKYAELLKRYPQLKDLGTIQEVSKTLKGLPASDLEAAMKAQPEFQAAGAGDTAGPPPDSAGQPQATSD